MEVKVYIFTCIRFPTMERFEIINDREEKLAGVIETEHPKKKQPVVIFLNGFLDLLEVMFLAGGRRTPLHVFGRWGSWLLATGILLNLYMAVLWVIERRLRVRPLLLFGVILIILGVQFISIGLLAALIHAPGRRRTVYPVRSRIPDDSQAG